MLDCDGTNCDGLVLTLTCGCVTLPEGESFSQSSAETVNLCLTGQKHQDTTWRTEIWYQSDSESLWSLSVSLPCISSKKQKNLQLDKKA